MCAHAIDAVCVFVVCLCSIYMVRRAIDLYLLDFGTDGSIRYNLQRSKQWRFFSASEFM